MLEIETLEKRQAALPEMEKRFAGDLYRKFTSLFEELSQQGLLTSESLIDISRQMTLEKIDQGLKDENPFIQLANIYLLLPNISHPSVPSGKEGEGDIIVDEFGGPILQPSNSLKTYEEIGEEFGFFSNPISEKVAGPGYPFVFGKAAMLDRALRNFMLDIHTKNGYSEIVAPTLVNERSMFNTGALPFYGDVSFHIEDTDLFLNPTIEVQETNILQGVHFPTLNKLPLRLVGYSRSFRIEDKPMITYTLLHEFGKVEIFVATPREQWETEYERALNSVEEVLRGLQLPTRKVLLCAGSLGQGQLLTHDYFVHAPGSEEWWEVASCSYKGNFSSRRMNATYCDENGDTKYLDILNVTAVSIPRMLSAVLENCQQKNGNISVPHELRDYMQGITEISPENQMKMDFQ